MFKSFLICRRGATAMMFALCALALLGIVGAAVDYSRLLRSKAHLQTALDAATQAATVAAGSETLKRKAFNDAIAAHVGIDANLQGATTHVTFATTGGQKVTGTASANIPLTLMRVLGQKFSSISVTSAMETGVIAVEFALALDVSGSMKASMTSGQARIDALKTASKALIDTVTTTLPSGSTAKYGIVPFTMNVNVGPSNTAFVTGTHHALFAGTTWAGCVFERAPPHHVSRDYDGSVSSPKGQWHAYVYPPEPNSGGACYNKSNGTNKGYATVDPLSSTNMSPYVRGPNMNCVRHAMMPLTSSTSDAKTKIDSLTAEYNNGTIIAPGVAWGLRVLSPGAPFVGAEPFSSSVRKVIVVLTDGEQTTEFGSSRCATETNTSEEFEFRPDDFKLGGEKVKKKGPRDYLSGYGYIYDSDPFENKYSSYSDTDPSTDKLSLEACSAAKKEPGVEIYAIAVSSAAGPGTRAYNMLSKCATSSNHFFYATDQTGMVDAFKKIAINSTMPRRTI